MPFFHLRLHTSLSLLGVGLLLVGCVPSLSPLYRDFVPAGHETASASEPARTEAPDDDALLDRAARALRPTAWTLSPPPYDALVLRTEERTVGNLGLYRTVVTLEVVPLRGGYVRVYVHPYRHYLIGGRSKLPYLSPSLRRAILPELEEAFEAEGLRMIGTARQRDEDQT